MENLKGFQSVIPKEFQTVIPTEILTAIPWVMQSVMSSAFGEASGLAMR